MCSSRGGTLITVNMQSLNVVPSCAHCRVTFHFTSAGSIIGGVICGLVAVVTTGALVAVLIVVLVCRAAG